MRILLILPILALIFISGCIGQKTQDNQDSIEQAKSLCIALCRQVKQEGINLNDGPCLSNNITQNWVCDVAHSPRIAADNLAENQCPAFGKTAQHFVEVNPDCGFIRSV